MTTLRRFKLHDCVLLRTEHLGQPQWETGQITGLRWRPNSVQECEVSTRVGKAEWIEDADVERLLPHPAAGAKWTDDEMAKMRRKP